MSLTVEDGTGVDGADSYISLDDARLYASSRGLVISTNNVAAEIQLRKAFDLIESYRSRYQGLKAVETQAAQWPRTGVYVDGYALAANVVPTEIAHAQVHLAAQIELGLDLRPTTTGPFVVREKIGPLETEYSTRLNTSGVPIVRVVEDLLTPYLAGAGSVTVMRV